MNIRNLFKKASSSSVDEKQPLLTRNSSNIKQPDVVDNFTKLPPEMLVYIASFLNFRDLLAFAQVNQLLYHSLTEEKLLSTATMRFSLTDVITRLNSLESYETANFKETTLNLWNQHRELSPPHIAHSYDQQLNDYQSAMNNSRRYEVAEIGCGDWSVPASHAIEVCSCLACTVCCGYGLAGGTANFCMTCGPVFSVPGYNCLTSQIWLTPLGITSTIACCLGILPASVTCRPRGTIDEREHNEANEEFAKQLNSEIVDNKPYQLFAPPREIMSYQTFFQKRLQNADQVSNLIKNEKAALQKLMEKTDQDQAAANIAMLSH